MVPIVNHDHGYVMLYSAKVACTALRELYLRLHQDEFNEAQRLELNSYHNLNTVFKYELWNRYPNYKKFIFTRNPYSRIVSAFLDQYVYARGERVHKMLREHPPINQQEPQTFLEFLRYLEALEDKDRDSHFQTQSYFGFLPYVLTKNKWRYKLSRIQTKRDLFINDCSDVSQINTVLPEIYGNIFAERPDKLKIVTDWVANNKPRNSIYYAEQEYPDAANRIDL
ncbi:MAG: sulfotransferase family 2 domain-containing protein [Pseudomonadota bacterium]